MSEYSVRVFYVKAACEKMSKFYGFCTHDLRVQMVTAGLTDVVPMMCQYTDDLYFICNAV